jgi:hypothetical protein
VKVLFSTPCGALCTLKSGDFIGAYLQAKVIGHHFVLSLEYAYYFPEYAKYFKVPLLLDKGIHGLVYSGKYWKIEFSMAVFSRLHSISSRTILFCPPLKHNQWLCLLYSLLMTCYMLEAMIPLRKLLKIPSKTALT